VRFNEKKLIGKQRRLLEADLDGETESKKPRFGEPDMAVYERTYATTMVPRARPRSVARCMYLPGDAQKWSFFLSIEMKLVFPIHCAYSTVMINLK
jgi:hypothetical protein